MKELLSLSDLVNRINAEANLADACANQAVVHAARAGAALNEAKAQVAHGEWMDWLKENCPRVGDRQANQYMRIAREMPELISNPQHAANLNSIRSAIALLSAPDETRSEIQSEMEAGRSFTEKEVMARIQAAKAEAKAEAQAEKATANRRLDEWRSQAIAEKKAREEAEAAAKLRANELAKLKGSVDESANRLAAIRTGELKAELEMAKLEKAELDKKLKSAKAEREDAINRGVTNRLREQQEQVSRIESQLQALEHRRESLKRQIEPMEKAAASAAHHDKHVRSLDQLINQASLEVMDAFDPDFCTHLPAHFVEVWERGIDKLRQLTAMLEQQVSSIHVMRLEREL